MQAKRKLRLVPPTHQNRTMPLRPVNADLRKREYLTPHEIDRLIKAASKSGKTEAQGQRNATLVLAAYRHGLRARELCDLEWSQVDWKAATLHVRRVKSGKPAAHPIRGDELRALRELKRNQEPASPFVFTTERGGPFTTDAVNRLVKRLGESNRLFGFPIHIHMLRHSCGYALAMRGMIRVAFRTTSGTRPSSTPFAIPS